MSAGKITWSADIRTTGCHGYAPRRNAGTILLGRGGSDMEWEIVVLLVLGLPFALYSWMRSGLGRSKKSTPDKSVA